MKLKGLQLDGLHAGRLRNSFASALVCSHFFIRSSHSLISFFSPFSSLPPFLPRSPFVVVENNDSIRGPEALMRLLF